MNGVEQRAERTGIEHRDYHLDDIEVRAGEGDVVTFEGVASVVDTPYTVRDQYGEFQETIAAGAFDETLKAKADVALFVNHQHDNIPLATRAAGSLVLKANPNLAVAAKMNGQRTDVQNLRLAVNDGIMRQMSIGFSVPKSRQTWSKNHTERMIHEVRLVETSVVWRGASPTTTASVRSMDELIASLADEDIDPDELRRAIASLTSRLPVDTPAVDLNAEVLANLALWGQRLTV